MNNHKEEWQKMHDSKRELIEKFKDRKFGMFIHFGLYAMLAGEWQGKRIEEGRRPFVAEWIMHAFKISRKEYGDLAKDFNPNQFSAHAVASLAKKAGMKYLVITSKHHDGFALYNSKVSDFNICHSPYGKDLINELYDACNKAGIEFGLYYSHSIDWTDGGDGGIVDYFNNENSEPKLHAYNEFDPSPVSYDDYIHNKALPQVKEILEAFQGMTNIWFDVPYFIPEKYSFMFYKTCYEIQPRILISQRVGNGYGDIGCPGDNVIPQNEFAGAWETVGTMNNSWGFKHYDHDWKYPKEVLYWLIDIVSKGGNYMLNVGPDGKGNVPEENIEILSRIGEWLALNGEAVYGTKRWKITSEGNTSLDMAGTNTREEKGFKADFTLNDFWFTQGDKAVYAISLYNGKAEKTKIQSIGDSKIKDISLLENSAPLNWSKTPGGVEIVMPKGFESNLGFVLKIELNY